MSHNDELKSMSDKLSLYMADIKWMLDIKANLTTEESNRIASVADKAECIVNLCEDLLSQWMEQPLEIDMLPSDFNEDEDDEFNTGWYKSPAEVTFEWPPSGCQGIYCSDDCKSDIELIGEPNK